ncbi:MAG: Inner membrane protein translocase and chaperone YidC, short form OxaI-like, partial [uncultured Nocardioides sp.]
AGLLPRHRRLHHGAAVLRDLGDARRLPQGVGRCVRARDGCGLGALDHLPDPGDPDPSDPALRQADQVQPQHAAHPAEGEGAAEEVRPRQGEARPGDDGALSRDGHQPVRVLSAHPAADADLLGAVPPHRPGREAPRDRARHHDRDAQRAVRRRRLPGREDLRHLLGHRPARRARARGRPGRRHDGDDVPHPAPADEQEHAGRCPHRPVRPAAEVAALRPAARLRGRRHRVPGRRAVLLDHLQPVDDGPAVLRHPQQPRSGDARLQGQGAARQGQGRPQGPAAGGRRERAGPRRRRDRQCRGGAQGSAASAAQAADPIPAQEAL